MAEAAVSFVLERLADILDQIEVNKGLHKEVEGLQAELKWMQRFLKDADAKQEDDEREHNWEKVLNTILSLFARRPNGVLAILALSYIDLPHYLKFCFLYLGLFRLWIAEGLIPRHGERMEDIAEDYLNELIDRNMVEVAVMSTNFEVSCLKYLSPGLQYLQRPSSYSVPGNLPSLHSISRDFKLLTVLALEDMKLCTVTSSIGKLIHLKYLGLKHNNLHELPSEIGYLSNLQTLDIAANFNLRIVPNAIHKMRNLRLVYMLQGVEDAA